MSACPSICPSIHMEQSQLPLDGFSWNSVFEYFSKTCQEMRVLLNSDNTNCYFTWSLYLFQFFLQWEIFRIKVAEKIKTTHFMLNNVFPKIVNLWDNVEIYGTVGQATGGNITGRMRTACWINKAIHTHTHAHARARAHTLKICNIYFPRQKWLRERASISRLYIYCLSFYNCYRRIWWTDYTKQTEISKETCQKSNVSKLRIH